MKKIALLVVLGMFFSCENLQRSTENKPVVIEKESINEVLDAWHKNAAETDFEAYFDAMSSEGIFIGTDASENWTIPEFKDFCEPYFDKGSAWDFKAIERNIYFDESGDIAWFDELLNTWMGVCRGSGVLSKNENGWKIEHYVLSITIPNNNIEEVVAINKEKDSLFLSRFKQ